MTLRIFIPIAVLMFCAASAFPVVRVYSVASDLSDWRNLTDGNPNTFATGKAGENYAIFQFGSQKCIRKVVFSFAGANLPESISLYSSDDFISWTLVRETRLEASAELQMDNLSLSVTMLKAVIRSKGEFRLCETEFHEGLVPENKIGDIAVADVGENSAVIRWTTLDASQDYLYYAKKYNGKKESVIDLKAATSHEISLQGLLKGTEYQFKIVSEASDGRRVESPIGEFMTLGIPFPDILELEARGITPDSARIYFRCNVPVSYEILAGTDENQLKEAARQKIPSPASEFTLSGLRQETPYFYRIHLSDERGNADMSKPLAFVTPADNIALGKKATGTFNTVDEDIKTRGFGNTSVEKVVDGNLNYFGGMAISSNTEQADQFISIDLGESSRVRRVDVYWWGLSYSRDYEIDFSDDGVKWRAAATGLDAESGVEKRSPAGDFLIYHSVDVAGSTKYVRLFTKAGSKRGTAIKKWDPKADLYICEIRVIRDFTP